MPAFSYPLYTQSLARPRPVEIQSDPRESRRLLRLAVSVIGRHALRLLSDPNIGSGANLWIRLGGFFRAIHCVWKLKSFSL
jgi:hypothetical protein